MKRKPAFCILAISVLVLIALLLITAAALAAPPQDKWSEVAQGGIGSFYYVTAQNKISAMEVFDGDIYVGTSAASSGGYVFRKHGTGWLDSSGDGFGDGGNNGIYSLKSFSGYLYAGTYNNSVGAEIWRTDDGKNWAKVSVNGFGSANNKWAYSMASFAGHLYVGLQNTTDHAQVYKTDGGGTGDWAQVNASGFESSPADDGVLSMLAANGRLYCGTYMNSTTMGCRLWSTAGAGGPPYTDWTDETYGYWGYHNRNYATSCFTEFNSQLYVGLSTQTNGLAGMWKSGDGQNWSSAMQLGFG